MMMLFCLSACSTLRGREFCLDSVIDEQFVRVPLTEKYWAVVYDGGGDVVFESLSESLVLRPKSPKKEAETFAALVTLKELHSPLQDYAVRVEVSTITQLRENSPNDWEVFWFFGNYRWAPSKKKEANYFILKPRSGVEFGTVFDEVGQSFLKTKAEPVLHLGERVKLLFVKKGPRFQVYKQDKLILSYHDRDAPGQMFSHPGTFGLYSEDALVRIHSFEYLPL